MATDVTRLPGSALPLSPGHLHWELAVVLKGSGELPAPGSHCLSPALCFWPILPSGDDFLGAPCALVIAP